MKVYRLFVVWNHRRAVIMVPAILFLIDVGEPLSYFLRAGEGDISRDTLSSLFPCTLVRFSLRCPVTPRIPV